MAEGRRLVRLTKIVLALPEAERSVHGSHATFTVRKTNFAYFLDDHHGDGIVAVSCRAALVDRESTAKNRQKRRL